MGSVDASTHLREALARRGADTVAHPGGTLLAHLVRTEERLRSWGAEDDVALAGLGHAAYGTDGFPHALWDPTERPALVELIGADAEAGAYLYGSCDRHILHPQIGTVPRPQTRDRFTDATQRLTDAQVRAFVAITVANEIDIADVSPTWAEENGPALMELFQPWEQLMPHAAASTYQAALAPAPSEAPDTDARPRVSPTAGSATPSVERRDG